jgi:hypothetical protein
MRETINTVAQVVMAVCAVGALLLALWRIPHNTDTKIAIARLFFDLSAMASFAFCGYFALVGASVAISASFALYTVFTQAVLFATGRLPASRGDIVSFVFIVVLAFALPGQAGLQGLATNQARLIEIQRRLIEIQKSNTPQEIPRPTPIPP